MLGFNPGIQKHKALAHDMYIGSNALQRRFVPPLLKRLSWLQLVIAGLIFLLLYRCRVRFFSSVIPVLGTGICKGDARVKPEHDVFLYVMSGSSPNMTKKNKAGHDK